MKSLKTIAAGAAIAGALGFAAIGVSEGVASAAPVPGGQFAQDPGWGHGPDWGHDHGGGWPRPTTAADTTRDMGATGATARHLRRA
jgi:hypothetical protein